MFDPLSSCIEERTECTGGFLNARDPALSSACALPGRLGGGAKSHAREEQVRYAVEIDKGMVPVLG